MKAKTSQLSNLKNIGQVTEGWLNAVGIYTKEDLAAVGVVQAYQMIKFRGENVSLNLLWALQGALMNVHWQDLPPALKERLKKEASIDAE